MPALPVTALPTGPCGLPCCMREAEAAVWVEDGQGRIAAWSRGAEKLFGYREAEIKGTPANQLFPARQRAPARGTAEPVEYEMSAGVRGGGRTSVRVRELYFNSGDESHRATCAVACPLVDRSKNGSRAVNRSSVAKQAGNGKHVGAGQLSCPLASGYMVGRSPELLSALRTALLVADCDATVLLCGESGTGKELLARTIHERSRRSSGPFVAVNCAAVPESLLEAELFGHEKGAFTGAASRRLGRFERASGGTLFLDEVADMAPPLQAKILRALEEQEIERLGGEAPVHVDLRVIAATNRHLTEDVADGRFREDLYFRLAVVAICLPPLRERPEDIATLARHFLSDYASEYGRPVPELPDETVDVLESYGWPGNIRELRNTMQRAVALAEDNSIGVEGLPAELRDGPTADELSSWRCDLLTLEEVERRYINQVLVTTGGQLKAAAKILGVHRNTLRRKLQQYEANGAS